jgi:hypothetical protein
MAHVLKKIMAAAAFAVVATGAGAATVTYGPTPTTIFMNPVASASFVSALPNSANFENVTSAVGGANPWGNNDAGSFYSSVGRGSSLTYSFGPSRALSFLWGTPDSNRNDLIFHLVGGGTLQVDAQTLGIPGTSGSFFVTISDVGVFDKVTFASDQRAFEFANVSATPVPLPAALPLLLAGLAGLVAVSRRRKPA